MIHAEPRATTTDRRGRATDIYGQRLPRRLGMLSFIESIPGFAAQFNRKVPASFWSLDDDSAVVACPCGGSPAIGPSRLTGCEPNCPRYYLFTGDVVWVAGSPVSEPTVEEAPDESHPLPV